MNKPISAKCYSRILNELEQISPKMRGSRKYNCKKGGVDCEVSRRERDIPNTFWTDHLFPSVLTSSLLFRRTQFNIQSNGKEKNSLEESFTSISQKCLRILFWPPPSNFFSSHTRHEYFHTPTPRSPSLDDEPQAPRKRRQERTLLPTTSKPTKDGAIEIMRKYEFLLQDPHS